MEKLDPEWEYHEVYNRYAHILAELWKLNAIIVCSFIGNPKEFPIKNGQRNHSAVLCLSYCFNDQYLIAAANLLRSKLVGLYDF
mgnify:CR=1 FL=1